MEKQIWNSLSSEKGFSVAPTDMLVLFLCFPLPQILEAVTLQHIFMNNFQLCSEINERVVQHFVHCTETHGRHVQYLKFLQTIVKAENKFIKKCQDIVMAEVGPLIFFYTRQNKISNAGNICYRGDSDFN